MKPNELDISKVIWQPNPGPQMEFLASPYYEVFFGGAAGGGKSDALLVDALSQVKHPKYRALLIRRSYPELTELIDRSRALYPIAWPGAKYHTGEKRWTFPSGARIEFGYCESDSDVYRYQGQEFAWLGIDEATHLSNYAYSYLCSRIRSSDPAIKCYVRLTSNPGGIGHAWVKARFIDPAPPKQPVYDDETGQYRVFIPSMLADNPHLARTDYGKRLMSLPEADRKALLYGDWNAYSGRVFDLKAGIHVWTWKQFKERTGFDRIPSEWNRFRSMDWGFARPFAIYWYALDYDGRAYVYREWYGVASDGKGGYKPNDGLRMEPERVAEGIASREEGERIVGAVADPSCWSRGKGDYGGGPSIIEAMSRHGIMWSQGKNDRIQGKVQVHNRMIYQQDEEGHLIEPPGMIIIQDECPHLLRTLPSLEYDKHRVEDIDTTAEDHAYDSVRYFCMSRPWTPKYVSRSDALRAQRNAANRSTWTI